MIVYYKSKKIGINILKLFGKKYIGQTKLGGKSLRKHILKKQIRKIYEKCQSFE